MNRHMESARRPSQAATCLVAQVFNLCPPARTAQVGNLCHTTAQAPPPQRLRTLREGGNAAASSAGTAPGSAYMLAVILLAMFAALAAAFAAATNNSVVVSRNFANIQAASFAAESGVAFAVRQLSLTSLPGSTTDETVIANLAARLGQRLNGTPNLAGGVVTCDAGKVTVPRIQTDDGAFDIYFVQDFQQKLSLEVHGLSGGVTRVVAMDLTLTAPTNSAFDYGIACKGSIFVGGNAEIRGKNALTEASVVSAASGPLAVSIGGNAVIDGDISSVGAENTVVISGSPTVAGSQDPAVIAQHVHFGVDCPVFPEADPSVFRPVATTIIDKTTNTSSPNLTFDNPLIKANTNPTFASDVTLNGVVYIEAPNSVTFAGKVTLNGLVAGDGTGCSLNACRVSFAGQVEAFGVEALPDLPQYAAAKALTGTFIDAPGFDVSFAGQFSTINGTVAADRLTFSSQAEGTVKGSVIGLADHQAAISGSVQIIIDRSGLSSLPAGFSMPKVLKVDPSSYRETGQVARQ